jgi:hypothetical protein
MCCMQKNGTHHEDAEVVCIRLTVSEAALHGAVAMPGAAWMPAQLRGQLAEVICAPGANGLHQKVALHAQPLYGTAFPVIQCAITSVQYRACAVQSLLQMP